MTREFVWNGLTTLLKSAIIMRSSINHDKALTSYRIIYLCLFGFILRTFLIGRDSTPYIRVY